MTGLAFISFKDNKVTNLEESKMSSPSSLNDNNNYGMNCYYLFLVRMYFLAV